MTIENRSLEVGTRLVANYKKQAHVCAVEKTEEGGRLAFVLQDGRKFKSPSSAGSAVMGGQPAEGLPPGHPRLAYSATPNVGAASPRSSTGS